MNKKGLKITLIIVALLGIVGTAAYFTKGFTNFNFTTSETEETESESTVRYNYRSFDFSSDQSGSLTKNTAVNFINNHNRENKGVFSGVATGKMPGEDNVEDLINYTFTDKELGIRLGTESNLGYCILDCVSNFKFDHIKIEAVNYNRKTEGESTYVKETEGSILGVNGVAVELKASAANKADTKVVKQISFTEEQTQLRLLGSKGRPCILKLELWSE